MITVSVTSDSSLPELNMARRIIIEMIESRANDKLDAAQITLDKICETFNVPKPEPTFNATELAEAEQLGKPVCSTVGAEVWQTAHADTTVNTSIPTPQSVFGQPAQTVENAVNPVAQTTDDLAVDAEGLVWDSRIHSSSRELNKDGTWRKRRGVDSELVKQVEAELRGAPIGTITEVTDNTVTFNLNRDINDSETTVAAIPTELGMQVLPVEVSAPQTVNTTPMTFPELLDAVTKAMVAGQLTQARINEALNSIGVQALPHLIARADLIPVFREALGGVV